MSDAEVVTALYAPVDLNRVSLDGLRRLAQHGPDAATRAAASKALKSRTDQGQQPVRKTVKVALAASTYGTPQPELQLSFAAGTHRRELRAALYELAGKLERDLVTSHEAWEVSVRIDSDLDGVVYVELMDGSKAEQARAMSALRAAAAATPAAVKSGWGGARTKKSEPATAAAPETPAEPQDTQDTQELPPEPATNTAAASDLQEPDDARAAEPAEPIGTAATLPPPHREHRDKRRREAS